MGKKSGVNRKGTIFVKESKMALLRPDEQDRPRFERDIRTYRVEDKGTKFQIFELHRRKKARQVKTIQKTKGMTQKSVISDVQSGKIGLNVRYDEKTRYVTKSVNIIQTNYNARMSRPQIVALVRVTDLIRHNTDHFIGYSKKIPTHFNRSELNIAFAQAEDMAVSKYIKIYGVPPTMVDEDIDINDYSKDEGFSRLQEFDTQILEYRFQYYKVSSLKR